MPFEVIDIATVYAAVLATYAIFGWLFHIVLVLAAVFVGYYTSYVQHDIVGRYINWKQVRLDLIPFYGMYQFVKRDYMSIYR